MTQWSFGLGLEFDCSTQCTQHTVHTPIALLFRKFNSVWQPCNTRKQKMWTSFDFQSGKIQKANCRHDPISNVFDGKETGISISHVNPVTSHSSHLKSVSSSCVNSFLSMISTLSCNVFCMFDVFSLCLVSHQTDETCPQVDQDQPSKPFVSYLLEISLHSRGSLTELQCQQVN